MNIAGSHGDGFADDQVNESNNRCAVFVAFGGRFGLGDFGRGEVDLSFGEFLQHRVDRLGFTLPVVSVDCRLDGLFGSHSDVDFSIENEPQLIEDFEVHRIADGDHQVFAIQGNRDDQVFSGDAFWDQFDHPRQDFGAIKVDEVESKLGCLECSEFAAGDVVEFNEGFLGLDAQFGGHLFGVGQLGLADRTVADQFVEPIGSHLVVSCSECPSFRVGDPVTSHQLSAHAFPVGIMERVWGGVK